MRSEQFNYRSTTVSIQIRRRVTGLLTWTYFIDDAYCFGTSATDVCDRELVFCDAAHAAMDHVDRMLRS
jgi:hypothetical protein